MSEVMGFPAHAGMDPTRSSRQLAAPVVSPPTRGWNPTAEWIRSSCLTVSPPTRGWTTAPRFPSPEMSGFPAHAGMDPARPRLSRCLDWFPRPRGDGPMKLPQHVVGDLGFPAHAGMDPQTASPHWPRSGFPRPRGDGPQSGSSLSRSAWVSPPTRGWTHNLLGLTRPGRGFPAHAGMDPIIRSSVSSGRRFPRPRGDGPVSFSGGGGSGAVSPPTRGWTRIPGQHRCGGPGFPAHAGMDPSLTNGLEYFFRFPRPRGDGPVSKTRRPLPGWVSPPTRGWTHGSGLRAAGARGFPAHAGMDLPHVPGRDTGHRFPRPRGDGPHTNFAKARAMMVSPPTRGWTQHIHARHRHRMGFPAHAGMDLQSVVW